MAARPHRFLVGALFFVLTACAGGEPRTPTKIVDEIKEGPGVFSGEDGEFVIYRR